MNRVLGANLEFLRLLVKAAWGLSTKASGGSKTQAQGCGQHYTAPITQRDKQQFEREVEDNRKTSQYDSSLRFRLHV